MLLVVFLTSPAWSATAAPAPVSVSIADIRVAAIEKSPRSLDLVAATRKAATEAKRLSQWENPLVEVGAGIPSDSGSSETEVEVEVTQPIRPGDFGARARLSELLLEQGDAQLLMERMKLSHNGVTVATALWATNERKGILTSQLQETKKILVALSKGSSYGVTLSSERLLFEAHEARLRSDLLELEVTQLELVRALGNLGIVEPEALSTLTITRPLLPALPSEEEFVKAADSNKLGERRARELLLSVAKARRTLAEANRLSHVSPKIGFRRSSDGEEVWHVGIEFPFPLWTDSRSDILAERAAEHAASEGVAWARRFSDFVSARSVLKSVLLIERQAALHDSHVIPKYRAAVKGELERLRLGQATVASLWEYLKLSLEANLHYIQLTERVVAARLIAEVVTGAPYVF